MWVSTPSDTISPPPLPLFKQNCIDASDIVSTHSLRGAVVNTVTVTVRTSAGALSSKQHPAAPWIVNRDNSRTTALSGTKFCTNMYLENHYKSVQYQGHRSEVKVTEALISLHGWGDTVAGQSTPTTVLLSCDVLLRTILTYSMAWSLNMKWWFLFI